MVSNPPKGLLNEEKSVVSGASAVNEGQFSLVRNDGLSGLSNSFEKIVRSFREITSALKEYAVVTAPYAERSSSVSDEVYACIKALENIEETAKVLRETTRGHQYTKNFEVVLDSVKMLAENAHKMAVAIDTTTAEIVMDVNKSVSTIQASMESTLDYSEEFDTSVKEVSEALKKINTSIAEMLAGSQELKQLSEVFPEMVGITKL